MASSINIPASNSTCTVRIIDTTSYGKCAAQFLFQPSVPGHNVAAFPCFAFLITNNTTNTHILFDLGIRKDWRDGYPQSSIISNIVGDDKLMHVSVEKSITEILDAQPDIASTKDISAAIWSHIHWDHRGDISLFPPSTKLVIGPGTRETYPTCDAKPESDVWPYEYEGRQVHELSSSDLSLSIGGYPAYDYFGDGSFYLLSSPGHAVGHLCALARVTPDSFVFMGGDCAHHPGQYRPTSANPLPESVTFKSPSYIFSNDLIPGPPTLAPRPIPTCPGAFVAEQLHPHKCGDKPFYKLDEIASHNIEEADESNTKMQAFDADERVLVIIGHDVTVEDCVPFYPEVLNGWKEAGWKEAGWKEKCRWEFLRDFELDGEKVKAEREKQKEEKA